MTGEQARWGYENLNLDQAKLDALGFKGVMRPISRAAPTTWAPAGRACTPGTAQVGLVSSDWLQADEQIIKPMVKALGRQVRWPRRS
jgi:branched-chain amino acid transport system substrate-binding protein